MHDADASSLLDDELHVGKRRDPERKPGERIETRDNQIGAKLGERLAGAEQYDARGREQAVNSHGSGLRRSKGCATEFVLFPHALDSHGSEMVTFPKRTLSNSC